MAVQAMWVPGYVAVAENVGGGGIGSSDGPLKNYDGGQLGNVPDHDYQDVVGYRQGFGVRFRGKSDRYVWFHFPIPTPVIIDPARNFTRASLVRAFVMWRTNGGSQLDSFHIWDGTRTRLLQLDKLNLVGVLDGGPQQAGNDPKIREGYNMFTLPQPQQVFYGVGISVNIHFENGSDDSEIHFTSAGADFMT